MFDIPLRQSKDRLFLPLVPLVPLRVTPQHITLVAFISGVLTCVYAGENAAILFWVLNRALDCLDGVLARSRGTASELGGLLDLTSDFIIYSALPISLALSQASSLSSAQAMLRLWLPIAFVEATFHINNFLLFYCAATSAQKEDSELTSVTLRPALIEGFESGVIFTVMLVWPQYVAQTCWVMGVLVLIGTAQRFVWVVHVLSKRGRDKEH